LPIPTGVLLVVVAAGCGVVTPTVEDARRAFERENYTVLRADLMRLTSFQETDSLSSEVSRVPVYRLDFKAVVEYPEGLNTKCLGDGIRSWNCVGTPDDRTRPRPSGTIEDLRGFVEFRKTEGEWWSTDVEWTIESSRRGPVFAQREQEQQAEQEEQDLRTSEGRVTDSAAVLREEVTALEREARLRAARELTELTVRSKAETRSLGSFTVATDTSRRGKGLAPGAQHRVEITDIALKGLTRHNGWIISSNSPADLIWWCWVAEPPISSSRLSNGWAFADVQFQDEGIWRAVFETADEGERFVAAFNRAVSLWHERYRRLVVRGYCSDP